MMSWNVAGLRACIRKGFYESVRLVDADMVCLQEVKAFPNQIDIERDLPEYISFWNPADRPGYSGTMLLTKEEPISVQLNFGSYVKPTEGRVIIAEYSNFYLLTSYTPNSQEGLRRLSYRMKWEQDFRDLLVELNRKKPVIICGDLNVAHTPVDLARPVGNEYTPGFTIDERREFDKLLALGYVDTYRYFYPDVKDAYTYWSYRGEARRRNVGWRLDYFLVTPKLLPKVQASEILDLVEGSDHCPVAIDIEL